MGRSEVTQKLYSEWLAAVKRGDESVLGLEEKIESAEGMVREAKAQASKQGTGGGSTKIGGRG